MKRAWHEVSWKFVHCFRTNWVYPRTWWTHKHIFVRHGNRLKIRCKCCKIGCLITGPKLWYGESTQEVNLPMLQNNYWREVTCNSLCNDFTFVPLWWTEASRALTSQKQGVKNVESNQASLVRSTKCERLYSAFKKINFPIHLTYQ